MKKSFYQIFQRVYGPLKICNHYAVCIETHAFQCYIHVLMLYASCFLSFRESQALIVNILICVSVVERQRGERKKLTLIAYQKFSFVEFALNYKFQIAAAMGLRSFLLQLVSPDTKYLIILKFNLEFATSLSFLKESKALPLYLISGSRAHAD